MGGAKDTDRVSERQTIIHATALAIGPRALLIRGPSGSGKSALALQMMALGAGLIADDRTCIEASPDGPPMASAPEAIRGMIEARGIGLLAADPAPAAPIAAVVDLATVETERLPDPRHTDISGHRVPLFHKVESPHFPAALMQYMIGGQCLR